MDPTVVQAVPEQVLLAFINSGHWLTALLLILGPIIVRYLLKSHQEADDLKTQLRVSQRNAELKEQRDLTDKAIVTVNHRIDQIETNSNHRVEELSATLNDVSHKLELIYNKLFLDNK